MDRIGQYLLAVTPGGCWWWGLSFFLKWFCCHLNVSQWNQPNLFSHPWNGVKPANQANTDGLSVRKRTVLLFLLRQRLSAGLQPLKVDVAWHMADLTPPHANRCSVNSRKVTQTNSSVSRRRKRFAVRMGSWSGLSKQAFRLPTVHLCLTTAGMQNTLSLFVCLFVCLEWHNPPPPKKKNMASRVSEGEAGGWMTADWWDLSSRTDTHPVLWLAFQSEDHKEEQKYIQIPARDKQVYCDDTEREQLWLLLSNQTTGNFNWLPIQPNAQFGLNESATME